MTEVKRLNMNKENNANSHQMPEKKTMPKNSSGAKKTVIHSDDRAKKLKYYSIGSVVLLIAIVLLANILFDGIFGKALTFDFSESGQNTISQVSVDYINSLPADAHIRIVGLFNRPDNVAGTPYQCIVPLLDDYARKSDGKISVEYINMTEQPTIITQLDPSNSYNLTSRQDSYVVSYNGSIKVIDPMDCYSYDDAMSQYYGKYIVTGNNTEFTFTNTMYNLTNNYSYKAYVVTGLKEAGNIYLDKILESMSVEVLEIPASENFTIPDDCDLLILNGPNNDISEKMYIAMTDYLNKGGKMFVAVNCSLDNASERYDRLNELLNQMNINIDPVLVYENDPGYQLSGYNIDSTVMTSDVFKEYSGFSLLRSIYARSVREITAPDSGIETYPVLMTSEKASLLEVDGYGNVVNNSGIEGQYNVAMYASGSNQAKVFVFGTLAFTSDEYISSNGLNDSNVEFFKSCIRNLSSDKPVNALDVPTKNVENFSLDARKSTTSLSTAILIIFMIVIPVILVAMAVIVYTKRKNL